MRKIGRGLCAAVLLALCLSMTGCVFSSSVDELYALPQMPEQYTDLENRINELIDDGAEYAAPASGTNLQPVQMVDLDGDGQEEALIFMRNSSDEKPLKIYIFRMENDAYEQAALLEGSGTSIYSVSYSDLSGDGIPELIVGWKAGTEAQALTVYALQAFHPVLLLSTTYTRYALLDSDRNGVPELVLIRSGLEEGCVAEEYRAFLPGSLEMKSSVRLSMTAAELSAGRVVSGTLSGGEPALFIMGVSADSSAMLLDILTVKGDVLNNITLDADTGYTRISYPYLSLGPVDINGDGCTEVPAPLRLPGVDTPLTANGMIRWQSFDASGGSAVVESTYHDASDGWYLVLPQAWEGHVMAYRTENSVYEASVTFGVPGEEGEAPTEFLRIYKFSGDNREVRASRNGRFILRSQQLTIYAAEFLGNWDELSLGLSEDGLREQFNLIVTEWAAGEN